MECSSEKLSDSLERISAAIESIAEAITIMAQIQAMQIEEMDPEDQIEPSTL